MIRILDPLLHSLLDSTISFRSQTVKVSETRLPILVYQQSFDQLRVQHVLDNLLALARFGGQGFIRIAKSSWLKHTLDPALRERVMSCAFPFAVPGLHPLLSLRRADVSCSL
jgi:hypothetical protein